MNTPSKLTKRISYILSATIFFLSLVLLVWMILTDRTDSQYFVSVVFFTALASILCFIETFRNIRFKVKDKKIYLKLILIDFAVISGLSVGAYFVTTDIDKFIYYFVVIQLANLPVLGYIMKRQIEKV